MIYVGIPMMSVIYVGVGVKFPNQTMGLGPHTESNHIRGESGAPKELSAQLLWAQTYLKGGPRRNVSSDVPNMDQACTLPTIRNHSNEYWWQGQASQAREREESIGCQGRNYNCRIKCKEATFLAALMWREQANSVTLATTTHRKVGKMSDGTGTQVKVQMINKCKTLMTSRRLYKRRESPWSGDWKKGERKNRRERERS